MRRRPEQNARVGPNRVDGETARGRGPPPRLSIRHLAVRGPCTAGLVSTRWPGQAVRTASVAESDPGVCGALRCRVPRGSRPLAAAAVAASASPPRAGQSWATWAAGHPRLSPGSQQWLLSEHLPTSKPAGRLPATEIGPESARRCASGKGGLDGVCVGSCE